MRRGGIGRSFDASVSASPHLQATSHGEGCLCVVEYDCLLSVSSCRGDDLGKIAPKIKTQVDPSVKGWMYSCRGVGSVPKRRTDIWKSVWAFYASVMPRIAGLFTSCPGPDFGNKSFSNAIRRLNPECFTHDRKPSNTSIRDREPLYNHQSPCVLIEQRARCVPNSKMRRRYSSPIPQHKSRDPGLCRA